MLLTLLFSLISFLIPGVVISAALIIAARSSSDRNKLSPFECGFDPMKTARMPFSTRFFLLAVIFLVFDIEIVLLMPMCLIPSTMLVPELLIGTSLFILILIIGLLHEWNEGSLDWSE
uniref:NADH dehydrogenase subunit 3 n=1 Tax=Chrysopetalum debile TaxID=115833 RepID=UPI001EDF80E2|nr:NADH dehydrogenase subunit 3 [Chrysopetalum debile]UJV31476.1 NADH dehydrogenase subunit 3 [Chrysopetalum debile]